MLAQVPESVWIDEVLRRLREERLAAVAGRRDSRGAVDVDADVPVFGASRLARVDSHPDPDRSLRGECSLGLDRRLERVGRRFERDEKGVPLRVDFDAIVSLERRPQEAAVLGERLRVVLS